MSQVECMVRMAPGRVMDVVYRHTAPEGTWYCKVCDRTVIRGVAAVAFVAIMRRRYR